MPVSVSTADPYSTATIPEAWSYTSRIAFDLENQTGLISCAVHADRTAAYSGKPPIARVEIEITPTGEPAVYGPAPLVSPYVPAVVETTLVREPGTNGPDDPGETTSKITTPAVDPVYGEAPLISAAVPSFNQLRAANPDLFRMLAAATDQLALTRPEFAGGKEVE